jgi:tetratricopeptide (TPR) repeat protein
MAKAAKSSKSSTPETSTPSTAADPAQSRERLTGTGRNDACPCGSGKKYKKCHLAADEQATATPPVPPNAQEMLANGWRLFEQRRPGAAEKEFKAALALDDQLLDARVGIGMSRLSAGNSDGAKEELGAVLALTEPKAEELRKAGSKDAFTKPEAQPYIRAAHALGCLAYDENRFADAVTELARVHSIDEGNVGIEARLIAAKSLMKLEKPAEAAEMLEPATKLEAGASRANIGLALAKFVGGDEAAASKALDAALSANAHYGKALLGRIRRRVENIAAAQPGSIEEALLYTQTYGDVWTDAAKEFLAKAVDARAAAKPAAEAAPAPAAPAAP